MNLSNMLIQIDAISTDSLSRAAKHLTALSDTIKNITPDTIKSLDWSAIAQDLTAKATNFVIHVLVAVIVFIIGKFLINKLHKLLRAVLDRRNADPSLSSFLLSLVKISLMFVLLIIVISILGIETSSFIAIFASAGVAVGMALSGTLQNFAGGVLILFLKPYKVGDYIEFGEYKGLVQEIQIFHTIISTFNNERIIIPNGGLSTGTVNNFSAEKYHREEWRVSISYGDDIDVARKSIMNILKSDTRIIQPPLSDESEGTKVENPYIALEDMADSSIVLVIRAWVKTADYWKVKYDVSEKIYNQLPKDGVSFPFPQLDVYLKNK